MASRVENADKEMGTSSLDDSGPPQKSRAQHIWDLGEVKTALVSSCFTEDRPGVLPRKTLPPRNVAPGICNLAFGTAV